MIKYRHGFSFAMPIVLTGFGITIIGLATLIDLSFVALGLILFGTFMWSSNYGVQIDQNNNRFREYGSIFGIKSGKWYPLDKLPFISIMKARDGLIMYSMINQPTKAIDDRFGVYLLSESHRKKVLLKKFEDRDLAKEYSIQMTTKLNKELVQFNPVVSQKTRERRGAK